MWNSTTSLTSLYEHAHSTQSKLRLFLNPTNWDPCVKNIGEEFLDKLKMEIVDIQATTHNEKEPLWWIHSSSIQQQTCNSPAFWMHTYSHTQIHIKKTKQAKLYNKPQPN